MRETKVYNFNELSDEAKEKAVAAHRFDFCDAWSRENWASIQAIAKACSLEVVSNNYNDTGFSRFVLEVNDYNNHYAIAGLHGSRAMAYIYNNWIMPNMRGKYYSALVSRNEREVYKKRYSKCTFVFECPFTGYGLDNCIPEAYNEFCELIRKNTEANIIEFIGILSQHVQKWLQSDYDNAINAENVASMLDCNGYEFFENGVDYK